MNQTFHGVIRGKTIELDHIPGFAEGQAVTVLVSPSTLTPGEPGIAGKAQSAAGCLAGQDSAEDDEILAQIQLDRKSARAREVRE